MNVYIQLPLILPKVQDQKSLTRRWLSFSGWGRERFSLVSDHKGSQYIRKGQRYTNVNILRLAIGYLIATINRNTRILEPEIGTDGSSQTRHNPRVDGYGSGFGLPRCNRSRFWTGLEPNRTVLAVWTRTAGGLPGPVANTRCTTARNGSLYLPWYCGSSWGFWRWMHIPDLSMDRKPELAWRGLTEPLGVGKATPREMIWCAEWLSLMGTETTIQNQVPERGWTFRWVLVSPGAHHNTWKLG